VHAPLTTRAAKRDVILAPTLAKMLREHWLASTYKAPTDFVFTNSVGRGLDYRKVGEGFRKAVEAADLHAPGKLIVYSLRHSFASLLIAKGLNVVFVSRQLGHANPAITLKIYAHLFAQADHAETARAALEASYAAIGEPSGK
jgi:integrase